MHRNNAITDQIILYIIYIIGSNFSYRNTNETAVDLESVGNISSVSADSVT